MSGHRRHRKVLRDNIQGITNPAVRRLARRGGVKRISGLVYEETRGVLKDFLNDVVRDTVTFTEHAHRKTVAPMDVVHALKRRGTTLYGYNATVHGPDPRRKSPGRKSPPKSPTGGGVSGGVGGGAAPEGGFGPADLLTTLGVDGAKWAKLGVMVTPAPADRLALKLKYEQNPSIRLDLKESGDELYNGHGFVGKRLKSDEARFKEQAAFQVLSHRRGSGDAVDFVVPIAVGDDASLMPHLPPADLTDGGTIKATAKGLDNLARNHLVYFDLKLEHLRSGPRGPILVDVAELYDGPRVVALAIANAADASSIMAELDSQLQSKTQLKLAQDTDADERNLVVTFWPAGFLTAARTRYPRLTFSTKGLEWGCVFSVDDAITADEVRDTLAQMQHLYCVLTAWAMAFAIEAAHKGDDFMNWFTSTAVKRMKLGDQSFSNAAANRFSAGAQRATTTEVGATMSKLVDMV